MPGQQKERYIPVNEYETARKLVQKGYDRKVLSAARVQLKILEEFIAAYDPSGVRNIYTSLSPIRRSMVIPAELPDAEYAEAWQAIEYEHKPFDQDVPEHFTSKGERVRSKSEAMIADALAQVGIPYRYECPLELGGNVIHPDFTVLRTADRNEIYWEHLGMMDAEEYCNKAVRRIRAYEKNGIFQGTGLVFTMETSQMPLNNAVIGGVIRHFFQ